MAQHRHRQQLRYNAMAQPLILDKGMVVMVYYVEQACAGESTKFELSIGFGRLPGGRIGDDRLEGPARRAGRLRHYQNPDQASGPANGLSPGFHGPGLAHSHHTTVWLGYFFHDQSDLLPRCPGHRRTGLRAGL